MGSGKSTIGFRLAQSFDWAFCDTDREIERSTGADIPWIFEKEGESGFRVREHSALEAALTTSEQVVSTGGGIVEMAENRALLQASDAQVIYLYAPSDALFKRIGQDPNRPLLANKDPKGTLQALLERRDPLYRSVADFIVETHTGSPKTVLSRIQEYLGFACKPSP